MIGFGALMALLSVIGRWVFRGTRTPRSRWFYRAAIAAIALPTLANSAGWIFTEMGRQPWAMFGIMTTAEGVSPTVSAGSVLTSLIVFTVLYGVLAVVDGLLMYRYAKAGPPEPAPHEPDNTETEDQSLVFAD